MYAAYCERTGISNDVQNSASESEARTPSHAASSISAPPTNENSSKNECLSRTKTAGHSRSNFQWTDRIRHLVAHAAVKCGADKFQKNKFVYTEFLGLLTRNGYKGSLHSVHLKSIIMTSNISPMKCTS